MMAPLIETFKTQHREIERTLEACEPLKDSAPLIAKLKTFRELVVRHLDAKDAFYKQLGALCTEKNDHASANLLRIFEPNMSVQSTAVKKFFQTLDAPAGNFVQAFNTVAYILRQRISTEEKAIFPMYQKHTP